MYSVSLESRKREWFYILHITSINNVSLFPVSFNLVRKKSFLYQEKFKKHEIMRKNNQAVLLAYCLSIKIHQKAWLYGNRHKSDGLLTALKELKLWKAVRKRQYLLASIFELLRSGMAKDWEGWEKLSDHSWMRKRIDDRLPTLQIKMSQSIFFNGDRWWSGYLIPFRW